MVPMKMTAAKAPAQIMRFTLNFWAAAEGGSGGGGGGEALLAPLAAARVAAEAALLAAARAADGVGGMVDRWREVVVGSHGSVSPSIGATGGRSR